MGVPLTKKYYSFEEYLALEEIATEKHEYHNGEIIEMAGGTGDHSNIANRTATALNNAIDEAEKNCIVFNSDLKVRIEKHNKAIYPDLSVVCGDIEYFNESETVLSNPILLIEVLSKSSKDYDKGGKFELYRSIPSFQEYMIIYQTIPKVQTWYKESEELWRLGNAEGLDQSITLHSIGCTIKLADIYKGARNLKDIPRDINSVY
ncbi:MAG: Uma2 family endonuclease [Bacteroidota bacterium]